MNKKIEDVVTGRCAIEELWIQTGDMEGYAIPAKFDGYTKEEKIFC